MASIRTVDHLQNSLDKDMGWRIKEISAVKIAAKASDPREKFYTRAGLALLYAHWEGFIRASSLAYLEFVKNQRLRYKDLKTCFCVIGLKGKLNILVESRISDGSVTAFDFIQSELNHTARFNPAKVVRTESNLSSRVFTGIATSISINIDRYKSKFNLIDTSLLGRRNAIAHGEYLDLNVDQFLQMSEEILGLMRQYKCDLETAASTESYRR